jgi:hypothetical protein
MSEATERVQLTPELCDKFWQAFCDAESRLARLPIRDFVDEANELLENFVHYLALEVQGVKDDPMQDASEPASPDSDAPVRELIISAHGVREYFPDLLLLASKAPGLRYYKVTAFRMRTDEPSFGMRMDDFELSTDEIHVGYYSDRGLIGIELKFTKSVPMDMIDHSQNMAMIMVDHVLGEFDFAVRVGAVNFVDEFTSDVANSVGLPLLASKFDSYWREELGRSGNLDFTADKGNWTMLSTGSRDDPSQNSDPSMPWIINVYDEAQRVATRADLGYRIEATVSYDDQEALDRARDLQEAWVAKLQETRSALMVSTRVSMGNNQRTCTFYVDLPDHYLQSMDDLARHHQFSNLDLVVDYDPSWKAYFEYFQHTRPATVSTSNE